MQDKSIYHKQDEKEKKGVLEMVITSFEVDSIESDGYYPVSLNTNRGVVHCRYYAAATRDRAVVCIGGENGGWNTPMKSSLYPNLCRMLSRQDINCLRVEYRFPENMAESMLDTLAGITFLTEEGAETVGLVGHAEGASVAIQTAATSKHVSAVVAISPRVFGFNALASLQSDQSVLMLHGSLDRTASATALSLLYQYSHGHKKIVFYSNAGRNLDEVAPEASRLVRDWLKVNVV